MNSDAGHLERMTPRKPGFRRRPHGFTLLEATIVSILMAFMAWLLASAWAGVAMPAADLIARSQLVQEMDMALAALGRDFGGNLANPSSRLGEKNRGKWVGWMQSDPSDLWLCFDGGDSPNNEADWDSPDTIITYQLIDHSLVRWDQTANTTFTVARNVDSFEVSPDGADGIRIELTFKYRDLTRSCTLITRTP